MTSGIVIFGWPNPKLSPNKRIHWAARNGPKKKLRHEGFILGVQLRSRWQPPEGIIDIDLTFCPAAAYHYDRDNLQAAMKAGLDGLADGLGLNDRRFRPFSDIGPKDPDKRGFVRVELKGGQMIGGA